MDFSFLVELGENAHAVFEFMRNSKVSNLIDLKRPVICFEENETVSHALQVLSKQKITAAAVNDRNGTLLKFVDMLDMVSLAVSTEELLPSNNLSDLLVEGKIFSSYSLKDVKGQDMVTVQKDSTMLELFSKLAKSIHRVAVLDNQKVISIISQSDIAKFFVQNSLSFINILEIAVEELDWIFHDVVQVDSNESFIDALKKIRRHNVSAAAVVDEVGKITSNISATDIQEIPNEWNFSLLELPVNKYLEYTKRKKSPVICFKETTLETIMLKMAYHRIHRVYVVDRHLIPIGIISLTDIVKFFVKFYQQISQ